MLHVVVVKQQNKNIPVICNNTYTVLTRISQMNNLLDDDHICFLVRCTKKSLPNTPIIDILESLLSSSNHKQPSTQALSQRYSHYETDQLTTDVCGVYKSDKRSGWQ